MNGGYPENQDVQSEEKPVSKPIRIAQVLNRMDSGGIEAVVMNYYRHIDHKQIQFDFYFAEDSTFPQRAELERLGAGIYPIPAYSHPLAYHKALYGAFREHGYKVVHAHLSTMSVFALFAAWRAGVPVRICHNHSTAAWGEGKKTLLKYLLRPFNKLFATAWFACGEKAGRWMYGDRAFEKGKVYVMPNAIDTEKFTFDPMARAQLRQELDIPNSAFVVGHVGRFTYAKNHEFLLHVFKLIKQKRPEAKLLLVGEGELEQQVKNQIKQLGLERAVIFTGAREDVAKLYSSMDVFCLPSRYEGFAIVALEAQVNGLACFFSDRITNEVILRPISGNIQEENVCQLPLAEPERWCEAILESKRQPTHLELRKYDIAICCAQIENFYLKNEERNG